MERLNIIDVNQILSFFQFIEQSQGLKYTAVWAKYEALILGHLMSSLDAKNLALIAHRFSHASQGSIEFWNAVD